MSKTSQLQIRVTLEEKAILKRLAEGAGQSVSRYVLTQVLPSAQLEFDHIVRELRTTGGDHRAALGDLGRLLRDVPGRELTLALSSPDLMELPATLLNYVTAMVEEAAHARNVDPPSWVAEVPPLERPHFMWQLQSLRPHQIRVTPVPFKRRNMFFDPSGGHRV